MTAVNEAKIEGRNVSNDISIINQTIRVWMGGLEPIGKGLVSNSWLTKGVSKINCSEQVFQVCSAQNSKGSSQTVAGNEKP